MARTAVQYHTEDLEKPEQKSDISNGIDFDERVPEIIQADASVLAKEYADNIAFMEEPVTVIIEPSQDKNAATWIAVWNNGKGCEVLVNRQWREMTGGYIPVGIELTIKRKYLAILAGSKIDSVETVVVETPGQDPDNRIKRVTTSNCSFTIIEDRNPKGRAWLSSLRRTSF